uniref:Uncharacterized protein n=1 Tax=Vespula pensylvanica TaxID=30213 RepID=A0A834KQM7_VESPE|nr:hypothetical protein H0235_013630 [Vespula pensylvanica]
MEEEEEEEEEEQEEEQEEQEEEVKACFKALNEFRNIQRACIAIWPFSRTQLSFYGDPLLPLSYGRFSPGDEYSSFAY